MSYTINSML